MNKTNLMDIDFLIPIRIDSVERIENLMSSIDYLTGHFDTNIYVLEASRINNHILERLLPNEIAYFFVEDADPIFHRTKYINVLAEKSYSDNIAIWDADVIIDYCQIIDAISYLREGKAEVAIPYDGRFYDTTEIVRNVFLELKDFHVLNDNISKMLLPYGSNMAGGAVFIRRENFNCSGGEDENFYGWGVEDWNRIEKWKKYGYRIERAHGPLFHLTHPRDINGRINSKWQKRNAYNTLRHTQESNFEETKDRNAPVPNKRSLTDKLHIGCGKCLLDGWINTDIKPCSDDILYMDITKPFPFQDNFFKYIFSEHVCEHITFKDYISSLSEIHRVLKPGGVYRVAMPTLDFLLNLYDKPNNALHSKYIQWSNDSFGFADQCLKSFTSKDLAVITLNNFMHNWGHKFIYSNEMTEHILKIAGFRNVKRCNIGESHYPELRDLEQHGTQIPNWANQLETVVYEGEKET